MNNYKKHPKITLENNNKTSTALQNISNEIVRLRAELINTLEEKKLKVENKFFSIKSFFHSFFKWLCRFALYSLLKNFTACFFKNNNIDLYAIFLNLLGGNK